jgi:hypothetical protein
MTSISVPPGCTGIELPNGKKIDANRQGKVTIDEPRDVRQAMKSGVAQTGVITRTALGFGHVKGGGAECTGCFFTGWKWQDTCPKCGSEMKIQETT